MCMTLSQLPLANAVEGLATRDVAIFAQLVNKLFVTHTTPQKPDQRGDCNLEECKRGTSVSAMLAVP